MKIKHWGFYLANIPFWDAGSKSYIHKTRPILVYNFSASDVICLPVTSNENDLKKLLRKPKDWEVSVKITKHSLIKVNKPTTIDKKMLFKYFGIQADTKTRNLVKVVFKNWVVLKEI